MNVPLIPEPLLSTGEVANLLGIDPKSVTRRAQAGELLFIRTLGGKRGHRRYPASQFKATVDPYVQPEQIAAGLVVAELRRRHHPYVHAKSGLACTACSKLAGKPITYPCATRQVIDNPPPPTAPPQPDPDPMAEVRAALGEL